MKKSVLTCALFALILGTSCNKSIDALVSKTTAPEHIVDGFVQYTIRQGQHYSDYKPYASVNVAEQKFLVRFDSSVIYQTIAAENQYDINKLYGFSDNDAEHHLNSARFGWRWSDGALRLFAYVYNDGVLLSEELGMVAIGTDLSCSISVSGKEYVFKLNDYTRRLPRTATTTMGKGYRLYPYFGGDEPAPKTVNILIREL